MSPQGTSSALSGATCYGLSVHSVLRPLYQSIIVPWLMCY
ncbi:MAG: hypothetical protein JWP08_3564 [Bryobacterales bacterium]|nr:hypothetical protein [Bryobacterales bacterium]